MAALLLIVVVDLIGFGIIIPLLPFYGEHFQASPMEVGLLMAAYSAGQFVAAPFWGRLSDRVGRRPVLLSTIFGAALCYVGLAYADSLAMLYAARLVGGLMAGNLATAFAYAADVTTPDNRAKAMGMIGAGFGLGFIAGPAIGGLLAGSDATTADFRTPALAAAVLSTVAFLLALARLRESLSTEARASLAAKPPAARRAAMKAALLHPRTRMLVTLIFLATFVFAGMESTFAMWSHRQLGWGPEQNGYLFAFVGVLSALVQGGLVGRLAKRFGERRLIALGAAMLTLGLLVIPFSTGLALLLPAMTVAGLGFSLLSPALNSLISFQASETEQGGMMGATRSIATLARVAGPAIAGAVFAILGREWPYFGGALVMAAVTLLAWLALADMRRPAPSKQD